MIQSYQEDLKYLQNKLVVTYSLRGSAIDDLFSNSSLFFNLLDKEKVQKLNLAYDQIKKNQKYHPEDFSGLLQTSLDHKVFLENMMIILNDFYSKKDIIGFKKLVAGDEDTRFAFYINQVRLNEHLNYSYREKYNKKFQQLKEILSKRPVQFFNFSLPILKETQGFPDEDLVDLSKLFIEKHIKK